MGIVGSASCRAECFLVALPPVLGSSAPKICSLKPRTFEPVAGNRRPTAVGGSEVWEHRMSDEFDSLDAIEKAGVKGALNRCRVLAAKIANELRNERPEHFVDKSTIE